MFFCGLSFCPNLAYFYDKSLVKIRTVVSQSMGALLCSCLVYSFIENCTVQVYHNCIDGIYGTAVIQPL